MDAERWEAAARVRSKGRVVVLAGPGLLGCAGLQAPERRGGLWDQFGVERCATPAALVKEPALAWAALSAWLGEVRGSLQTTGLSPQHRALRVLEEARLLRGVICTTTDGLARAAGVERVAELYGAIDRLRCTGCAWRGLAGEDFGGAPPRCAACGAALRPDMVLFEELIPQAPRALAAQWVYGGGCLLALGADLAMPPLHRVPEEMMQEGGLTIGLGPGVEPGAVRRVRGIYLGEGLEGLAGLVRRAVERKG
jgi:NAD-dependent deacetylase